MSKRIVTIEIDDVIEINDATDFALWADRFGVKVGARGRKPMAELARAIRDYDGDVWPTTIVDTEYFSASMGDDKPRESSPYGAEVALARQVRDNTIAAARQAFETERARLQAKYGVEPGKAVQSSVNGEWVVSARTPMLDKSTDDDGNETVTVQRTKGQGDKPGKVKFLPSTRKVTVTRDDVKRVREILGKRGRPSAADTLAAAVMVGEWFPLSLFATPGAETVLLKDPTVTPVEPVTADEPVADVPQDVDA